MFVRPVSDVVTVFPSDIMQYLSRGHLLSTPHKVRNTRERFALAYFHEPSFKARVTPLVGAFKGTETDNGAHFTNMFMQYYKDRVTIHCILDEDRLSKLSLSKM